MGKQGPCYHCGVTSSNATGTPLWRNGPPEKPILCNACGSRWRTKGSLTNYTPLHARAEPLDFEDFRVSKVKSITIKTKEQKFLKRKRYDDNEEAEGEPSKSDQDFQKVLEEDASNRSSSGSAISYSESCAHFGSTDACDLTGSAQSNVWDSLVPSKKRTCVSRPKPSPIEKLTKDLHCILNKQKSCFSGSSEEDLLFESEAPLISVEIGHGSFLIKHPNSIAREEESEASSLPIDNKTCILNDSFSESTSYPVHTEVHRISLSNNGRGKDKELTVQEAQVHNKRDKFSTDEFHNIQSRNSPLGLIDLRNVISFEEFTRYLTHEEQQQLMKYLPFTDTAKLPDSLKSMFDCPQFVEGLSSFQKLLLEGVFDLSFSRADNEEYRVLKRLALTNLTKSKWVEHNQLIKDGKYKKIKSGKKVLTGTRFQGSDNLAPAKRPRDDYNQNLPETKGMMRSPKSATKSSSMNIPSTWTSQLNSNDLGVNESHDTKDMDNDGCCFSPRSLFAYPPDKSSIMLGSLKFTDENSDQDLLFDVPSNASFPQAELLHFHPWKQKHLPNGSLTEHAIVGKEQACSDLSSSNLNSQQLSSSSMVYPNLVLP